jgi:hypothetical protein
MTSTKRASLEAHTESGAKQAQQTKIVDFLRGLKGVSRAQIAYWLEMRTGSVCARVNELLAEGRLVHGNPVKDPHTNRTVQTVKLAPEPVAA